MEPELDGTWTYENVAAIAQRLEEENIAVRMWNDSDEDDLVSPALTRLKRALAEAYAAAVQLGCMTDPEA